MTYFFEKRIGTAVLNVAPKREFVVVVLSQNVQAEVLVQLQAKTVSWKRQEQ